LEELKRPGRRRGSTAAPSPRPSPSWPRKGRPSKPSAATGRRDACRPRSRRPARTGAGSIVAQHRAWPALLERSSREADELDKLDPFARRALRDHPDPRRGFRHSWWRPVERRVVGARQPGSSRTGVVEVATVRGNAHGNGMATKGRFRWRSLTPT